MKFTVENVCGLLIGSRLLAADDVKEIYQRWQTEARDSAGDLPEFTHWLVAKQYVTEYQAALLAKGYTTGFFIQHYKILERLGKGRMANVYKAVHHLGQMVAIKCLPPSRSKDAHTLTRFQREAKLAVQLKHPNVVRSFQVGQFKGIHYLVTEYLEGETLDAVLQRRKKLSINEAVRLTHQALQGLQHIHELGLVHRDVKPANFMLTPPPSKAEGDTTLASTLKILDIELGRVLSDPGNPEEGLTVEGVLLGTPDYLAPEQARDPRTIDIRADIYSLGCILYQMLSGQLPFPDTNVLSQMIRHATETPKPLKELTTGVPDGLHQVVNVMLAKDPAQRYATPERAARALQPFLAGGNPARAAEEGPQLKKYLTWLEMNAEDRGSQPPAAEPPIAMPAKPERTPAPRQVPIAAPAVEFDAELLPPQSMPQTGLLPVANRDWYFLGCGAAAVIIVGLMGFALAWVMRG